MDNWSENVILVGDPFFTVRFTHILLTFADTGSEWIKANTNYQKFKYSSILEMAPGPEKVAPGSHQNVED